MKKKVLFTVGNELMGDDAAGPLLARRIEKAPLVDWDLVDGGNAPENYLHRVRDLAPDEVLIVDAADMDLEPGSVRLIDREQVGSLFLMTTHSLPLSFLMESLGESIPCVRLLGIQPGTVSFGYPVSQPVRDAVARVYAALQSSAEFALIG